MTNISTLCLYQFSGLFLRIPCCLPHMDDPTVAEHTASQEERSLYEYTDSEILPDLDNALQRHPDLMESKDEDGWTLLHLASDNGHLPLVQALLDRGADGSFKDNIGRTPLHLAACKGHLSVVEALLAARGGDGSIQDQGGWTSLHFASQYGHLSVAEALFAKGANINIQTSSMSTPLHLSSGASHLSVVEALLARGADPNIQNNVGRTPLHLACKQDRCLPIIQALLSRGADANILDKHGKTAFDMTLSTEILTMLSSHTKYQTRRQFLMFLSDYQFFEPPARFPQESVVEKVLVIEDLHRYLMTFL